LIDVTMTSANLNPKTLAFIQNLVQAANTRKNWKTALDKLLSAVRDTFVFDNVAIYEFDPTTQSLEIAYARAMGRGKSAEADAAWGGDLASQVFNKENIILQEPKEGAQDRLAQAYLLGLPIDDGKQTVGAMVFIRFGGPEFSKEQIALAEILKGWVAFILLKKNHHETQSQLELLERKALLQDDFIATISHELRTPLGFIKGYSTTLLRSDTTWTDENRDEFLTIIDEEADRLTQLIDNILESAKFQSRAIHLQFQPVRLEALIRDAANRIRARYKDLKVELKIDTLPPIQGDSIRLTQVFENLFNNAIKYAPGAKISITAKKDGDSLLVAFSDQGQGIPEAYLPYLFERFYRVPGEQSKAGSGLGLYICNHIIMAHHGKIWAESKVNQGTTFYIKLPVNPM
jgi:signal transduction histidine kinase